MCDGVEDCPLGDDELPSLCSKFFLLKIKINSTWLLLSDILKSVCVSDSMFGGSRLGFSGSVD